MKSIYKKVFFLLVMLPLSLLAQNTVTGIVVDAKTSQPIPGVNINVQGSSGGTSTDFDGKFKLNKIKSGDKVVASFVGYKNLIIIYTDQAQIKFNLVEDANKLQEVIVQVGYGSVKKKDATGSITTLSTKDFNKGANVSIDNLIQGRVAGVTINSGGGSPGSAAEIRIRGGSSLFASNDPLIVIDGLPVEKSNVGSSTSILSSINPNDIETFNILKDASATAIYGSRASNGVILITTKKGSKGKLAVDYNFQYGSGKVIKKTDVFNADEFKNIIQQNYPANVNLLGKSNTDWQDEIYRRTDYIDNNISLRGNFLNTIPARLSLGNTYQEGSRLTNYFNRSTISTSLSPSFFGDHLKLKLNASFSNEQNRFAEGVEGAAIRFDPTQPVYNSSSPFGGFFEYYNSAGVLLNGTRNPVARLLQTTDLGRTNRVFGNFEIDYKLHFFPAVRAVVNVGFDQSNGTRTNLIDASSSQGGSYVNTSGTQVFYGTETVNEYLFRNKILDAYLAYNKTFGKLNVEATAGYSYQITNEEKTESGNLRRGGLQPINVPVYKPSTDAVLIGYFGRAIISYNDKYILSLSFRRDGSSRIGNFGRYLNAPGVGFAWKLKNEFLKNVQTISDLKLRLGYGVTGQQSLGNADFNNVYLQQYAIGTGNNSQYTIGSTAYNIALSKSFNDKLEWERTTTYNAGLDFGLFEGRINGSLDVYFKKSDKQFQNSAIADGANFSNVVLQNIGSFNTKGIELNINAEVVKTKLFKWNVNFNVTKFERRVTELANDADVFTGSTGSGIGGTSQIFRTNFTPYSFFVYKQLYNSSGRPIEGAYADLNGDGIINGLDRYVYKNPDPDALFGFSSNMNIGNLDFSFNLRASVGNRLYNAVNAGRAQISFLKDNAVLGNIPTNVSSTGFVNTADVILSDLYIENASFLRCDNITLGYTFPKWLNGKASIRLFSGVQNAFIITKYSGLDPEVTNNGVDNTIYPRQRQFLFGANVKF